MRVIECSDATIGSTERANVNCTGPFACPAGLAQIEAGRQFEQLRCGRATGLDCLVVLAPAFDRACSEQAPVEVRHPVGQPGMVTRDHVGEQARGAFPRWAVRRDAATDLLPAVRPMLEWLMHGWHDAVALAHHVTHLLAERSAPQCCSGGSVHALSA